MTITKTHAGNFWQWQAHASYTITVSNVGNWTTLAPVSLTDTLPSGLTAIGLAGTGWTCSLATLSCFRSDLLPASSSFPPVTLTVSVAGNAPAKVTNSVQVAGGGEVNTSNDTANDPTTITASISVPSLGFLPLVRK